MGARMSSIPCSVWAPLLLLTKTNQLATFSLVWYLMFYTPLHTLATRPSVSLVLTLCQDWMRLREFY